MRSRNTRYILHKFKVGAKCQCPSCEQGSIFQSWFKMNPICPYCGVRFERGSGDAIGGVYINVALAELTAMTGFFTVHALFSPPIMAQMFIWVPYVLLFCLLAYRPTRGMWISVVYLTGGIYADMDYEREYIRSANITYAPQTPQEYE